MAEGVPETVGPEIVRKFLVSNDQWDKVFYEPDFDG